ncbi:MAG: hypothetical protein COB37_11815 [Kordiimonadales bacterium]|nr:MAG: hypothetical protein COB37_11815 [Kordiimonadales bacterium]
MWVLASRDGIFVFAVLRQKKTPTEYTLGFIAVIIDLYIVARPFFPSLDSLVYAQPSLAPFVGLGLMVAGLGLMVLCWFNMGSSWRIGVPAQKETSQTLITGGIYRYSRNPIYLGIMVFLVGTFIFTPGPLPLFAATATFFLTGKIIRKEELFLNGAFGAPYIAYCSQVRRWI